MIIEYREKLRNRVDNRYVGVISSIVIQTTWPRSKGKLNLPEPFLGCYDCTTTPLCVPISIISYYGRRMQDGMLCATSTS